MQDWSDQLHRFNVKCFCSTPNSNTQYAILVLIIDIKFNIYRKSINLKYRGSLDCPFSWEKIGKSSWLSEVVLVKTKLATSIMKTHTRSSNMSIYSFWIENKFINFRQCQLDDVIMFSFFKSLAKWLFVFLNEISVLCKCLIYLFR